MVMGCGSHQQRAIGVTFDVTIKHEDGDRQHPGEIMVYVYITIWL